MSSPELPRRLLAILAADAAGYSRQVAIDDRATVAALDAARNVFRSKIEGHAGRIIDTAGDSILAVFASATAAVDAALAIQEQLEMPMGLPRSSAQLQFRIGLHLGDVLEQVDGTVYGDGVNVASRLQALAPPGGIIVSQAVRNAAHGRVHATFVDLGKQTVKNIEEAVQTYGLSPRSAVLPLTPRLRGAVLSNWKTRLGVTASLFCLLGGGFWLSSRDDSGLSAILRLRRTASKQADMAKQPSAGVDAGPLSIVVLPFTNLTEPLALPRLSAVSGCIPTI